MQSHEQQLVEKYASQRKKRSIWRQLVRAMACIVVFCTTYALILPAITTSQTYHCGSDAHTHDAQCYTFSEEVKLICSQEEAAGHIHDETCFDEAGTLLCTLPESQGHTHETECFEITTSQCLACPLPEHTHTQRCRSNPEADLETAKDWERTLSRVILTDDWNHNLLAVAKSQIGYRESERNYMWEEGQPQKGYTRYGAWYGIPYGNWNAMFVSFCLEYAGIPAEEFPRESDPDRFLALAKQLSWFRDSGVPKTGDVIFFRESPDRELRMGIVAITEASYTADSPELLRLEIIEGAFQREVVQRMPELPTLEIVGILDPNEVRDLRLGQTLRPEESANPSTHAIQTEPAVTIISNDHPEPQPEITPLAQDASVTLNFYSWSKYNRISFPTGNNYTCPVGSTLTIVVGDSSCNYANPEINLTGATLVSHNFTCGTPGCSHNWCSTNPVHTFVFRITDVSATLNVQITGANWSNNSVTVTPPASGGDPDPTEPPETTVPEETTKPTEPSVPEETTKPTEPIIPSYPYYPTAVHTGDIDISRLRFYNLCENSDTGVSALPGCVFEVTGTNGYSTTIVSGNTVEIHLPDGIPDGTYTITEISAPAGYMRDEKYTRTFVVKNGALTSTNNIGTFINHDLGKIDAGKTGEVEDYNNRIYQVLLFAESHMRMYEMGPVDVLFVVDQSNSMLFPAGLEDTGKSVTLQFNGNNNVANMEALNLDKTKHYYIISDPNGTSTVWSVWYNGRSWLYQDASYYAKAYHNNAEGYKDPTEKAIFPENRSYTDQKNAEASGTRSNGGGLGYSLDGSGLGKFIAANNNRYTFKLYTATDAYNRLHYLEQSLENMIYELADINSANRVTLTRFTKEVDEENHCMGPLELTPENADALVDAVTHINTSGGTRQDIALKHVYENHLNNASQNYNGDPTYNYTILITDGAPVLSSGSNLNNLGSPNDAPSTTADSVYAQIQGYAALVRNKSQLMTVGLGMGDVEAGRAVLEKIATNNDFHCALDDAAELTQKIQELLLDGMKPKESISLHGDITDEISDSFYPIAYVAPGTGSATGRQVLVQDSTCDWILLQEGDWITLEGGYATAGTSEAAGQLLRKNDGTFYIVWKDQKLFDPYLQQADRIAWMNSGAGASSGRTFLGNLGGKDWVLLNEGDWITKEGQYYPGTPNSWNRRNYGQITRSGETYSVSWGSNANNGNNRQRYPGDPRWHGTFYLKAKEDFIGGNAIDTNKEAYVTVHGANRYLESPTVNVRLLGLNAFSSEVTVYLGDLVNGNGHAPVDSLMGFYDDIRFTKLIADGGNVLNDVTADSDPSDGLENAVFYLRYAMNRDLTADEWQILQNGGTVTIPYTYDHPSSHGPVGEFIFRLEATGIEGASPDFGVHEATAACQQGGQPLTQNCTNPAETYKLFVTYQAYGLGENGRPTQNLHNGTGSPGTEVGTGNTLETGLGTVVSENIHEVHVISGSIRISKVLEPDLFSSQEQTFTFTLHRMEDGEDTSRDVTKTITVPPGTNTGSSVTFTHLRRGTYTVTEATGDQFALKSITVQDSTNCQSTPGIGGSAVSVTFHMGNNIAGENVIGRVEESDPYTAYTDPVNGVWGEAVFRNGKVTYTADLPVVKVWDDGAQNHPADAVYVVLLESGTPVLDENGNARILRLDSETGWAGTFNIPLAGKDDSLSNYQYSIREVSTISGESHYAWHPAILENDGTTIVYYETVLEAGKMLSLSNRSYVVEYAVGEDGTWIVTNYRTVDLPETGSIGTTPFHTFGLLLILAAALMYFCKTGRKNRKEGN